MIKLFLIISFLSVFISAEEAPCNKCMSLDAHSDNRSKDINGVPPINFGRDTLAWKAP